MSFCGKTFGKIVFKGIPIIVFFSYALGGPPFITFAVVHSAGPSVQILWEFEMLVGFAERVFKKALLLYSLIFTLLVQTKDETFFPEKVIFWHFFKSCI